jgi:hypothetical protein
MADCNVSCGSQIEDTLYLDDIHLRKMDFKQQLLLQVGLEELKTWRTASTRALLDSGCVWTCVDEDYAREQRWPLLKIRRPIRVQYADGSSNDRSTIQYCISLRIRAAGSTVVTEALVTCVKTVKVFLGYDWLQATNPQID